MDNFNLLCQTIRFQRTALQNSLAMISAVQQHGEKLLKTTLEQSPWMPGEGKDACLFWAGIWTKNLTGITDLVDKNLATMERLTSTEGKKETKTTKPAEKFSAAQPKEQPASAAQEKETTEKKQAAPPAGEQEKSAPAKEAEQTAMVATDPQRALATEPPPEIKPVQPPGKQPGEKKKQSEPKP